MGGGGLVEDSDQRGDRLAQRPQRRESRRARDYFALAESYWIAAEGLADHAEAAQGPFLMLVAHSLELSLKAVLAQSGWDEEWLMMAGHHLAHCHYKACSIGFSGSVERQLAELVEILDQGHSDQRFRYPVIFGGFPRLDARDATRIVELHLQDVRHWIAGSAQ
jgi:hypothetical protein